MNRKRYILEKVKEETPSEMIDRLQGYADFVGLIPGFGDVVDLASAGVDVLQGQYGDAAFRGAAALPIVGSALGANKGLKSLLTVGSIAAPFAGGVVRAAKDDKGDEEQPKIAANANLEQEIKKQQERAAKKAQKDSPSSSFDLPAMARLYNTRLVDPGPFVGQSFRESLEHTTNNLMEVRKVGELLGSLFKRNKKKTKGTDKPDTEETKGTGLGKLVPGSPETLKKIGGVGVPALTLAAAGLAIPIIPGLLGSIAGVESEFDAGGQPLVPGSGRRGGDAGISGVGNLLDRLTANYGRIDNYNPAAAGIDLVRRRATATAAQAQGMRA